MTLSALYANLSCSDLERSGDWFETLFDRKPDAAPMDGLVEWHHADSAGLQLFRKPEDAGHGTLTLIVDDLEEERTRIAALSPGAIEEADYTRIARLSDPDGNLIVLAQPK